MRLSVQLAGAAVWHHRPAYAEIVHRARSEGLAGASVFHGIEGFGPGRDIHHERPARLTADGPCTVEIVDDEDRLRCFLLAVTEVLEAAEATVVLEPVTVRRRERHGH